MDLVKVTQLLTLLTLLLPTHQPQGLNALPLPNISNPVKGNDEVKVLEVSWPDGSSFTRTLQPGEMNSVVEVTYPTEGETSALTNDTQCGEGFTVRNGRCTGI